MVVTNIKVTFTSTVSIVRAFILRSAKHLHFPMPAARNITIMRHSNYDAGIVEPSLSLGRTLTTDVGAPPAQVHNSTACCTNDHCNNSAGFVYVFLDCPD